jgi:hypothetical protein
MKVHFAGNGFQAKVLHDAGVKYCLRSFYYIRKGDGWTEKDTGTYRPFNHLIIDSGLFTMMFGSDSGKTLTYERAKEWQDEYIKFIKAMPLENVSFVELDVQKKLGPDAAWRLRKDLRKRTPPGTSIINVYHLEDGDPTGLLEFSDYIAISQPELRAKGTPDRRQLTSALAAEARDRGLKTHLLGCTGMEFLEQFRWCDTCDSTSWLAGVMYDKLPGPDLPDGDGEESIITLDRVDAQPSRYDSKGNDRTYWSAAISLNQYAKYAGPQD